MKRKNNIVSIKGSLSAYLWAILAGSAAAFVLYFHHGTITVSIGFFLISISIIKIIIEAINYAIDKIKRRIKQHQEHAD